MRSVAIYARVSTEEQAERQTIQNQIHALEEYATRHDLVIAGSYLDEGVSAAIPFGDRPGGGRLLTDAESGMLSAVMVVRLDRLSRDVVDALVTYRRLQGMKVEVKSLSESFDDSPQGQFTYTIMSGVAQLERALITERTKAGRQRRVREGKYQASTTPYGYDYDIESGQLTLNPIQTDAVRKMFGWAMDGMGLRQIANRLDDLGIAPPSRRRNGSNWGWHVTTVYKILTHSRYTGKNTYAGAEMTCPAIVDPVTYESVQKGLARRKSNAPRNGRHFYFLRHVLYCRECGGRFMGRRIEWQYVREKDGSLRRVALKEPRTVYICRTRHTYGPKAGHEGMTWNLRADEVDAKILASVRGIILDPERFAGSVQSWIETVVGGLEERGHECAAVEAQLGDLHRQEMWLITQARKGLITEDQMGYQLEDIKKERVTLEGKLEGFEREFTECDAPLTVHALRRLADRVKRGELADFDALSLEGWRDLMADVIDKVWVERDGSLTLELLGEVQVVDFPRSR